MKNNSKQPSNFFCFDQGGFRSRTFSLVLFSLLAAGFLYGCKKHHDDDDADKPPTEASFNKLMDDGFNSLLQTSTFDASNGSYIYTSPRGTTVQIDGTCLRNSGAAVNGQVTLEFFEAYKRSDMIVANKVTMGKTATGDMQLLESGGEFYVGVKQNGASLTSACPVIVRTSSDNSGGIKDGMRAWDGSIVNGSMTWVAATSWEILRDSQKRTYQLNIPGLGWFNCDRFYNDPRPKTAITCVVPSGYATVSMVYLLVKAEAYGLGLATGGQFPVGLECYLIFVTEKDGQYRWITKERTIVNGHTEIFNLGEAQTGSRDDFQTHVASLL